MSGIFWLASYPKSGNTWLRILIENYVRNEAQPIDINTLPPPNVAYGRGLIDDLLGVESASLPDERIDLLRPRLYETVAASAAFRFVRTHEQHRSNSNGDSVFSTQATKGVVLLVRNPLDIAVSLAHFMAVTVEEAADLLADENYTLYPQHTGITCQLPQRVGSWSTHTRSWMESGLPLHLVKYEDLVADTHRYFTRIVDFLDLPVDGDRVSRAVAHSTIDVLQSQESAGDFRELKTGAGKFFRQGQANRWMCDLPEPLADRILSRHHALITELAYSGL